MPPILSTAGDMIATYTCETRVFKNIEFANSQLSPSFKSFLCSILKSKKSPAARLPRSSAEEQHHRCTGTARFVAFVVLYILPTGAKGANFKWKEKSCAEWKKIDTNEYNNCMRISGIITGAAIGGIVFLLYCVMKPASIEFDEYLTATRGTNIERAGLDIESAPAHNTLQVQQPAASTSTTEEQAVAVELPGLGYRTRRPRHLMCQAKESAQSPSYTEEAGASVEVVERDTGLPPYEPRVPGPEPPTPGAEIQEQSPSTCEAEVQELVLQPLEGEVARPSTAADQCAVS
ncbi:hypothetical protein FPQ18DRAFT_306951 [Pyronema domesticum]|nr:hypothetical protein FPQ18DRAFT_306951 [Pyronema domesticum]